MQYNQIHKLILSLLQDLYSAFSDFQSNPTDDAYMAMTVQLDVVEKSIYHFKQLCALTDNEFNYRNNPELWDNIQIELKQIREDLRNS